MQARRMRFLLVALAATIMAVIAPSAAWAQAEPANPPTREVIRGKLTSVDVVDVDKKSGKYVLTLENSEQIVMSPDRYAQWSKTQKGKEATSRIANGGVSTQGRVYGDCGWSELWLSGIGGLRVSVSTGYGVKAAVLWSDWWVDIVDTRGASEQYYPAGANGGTWYHNQAYGGMARGNAWAAVDTASYAVLWYGAICVSGGPSDDTYIY